MKNLTLFLLAAMALVGAVIGCGPSGKADTSKLEKSFQSAAAGTKGDAGQAAAAIKSGDFAKAVTLLQKVIKAGGLTEEQKDGISSAITGMQTVMSQNQNRYSVELYNSLSDLIDLLEGRQPVTRPLPK